MSKVRTKTVKRAAKRIIEKHYTRLALDFDNNKRICSDVAEIQSKRLRNQIAGFVTHLMQRILKGPVRGISLKLQEEERERRDNYAPEKSVLDVDRIDVDEDTMSMLKAIQFGDVTKLNVVDIQAQNQMRQKFQQRRKAEVRA